MKKSNFIKLAQTLNYRNNELRNLLMYGNSKLPNTTAIFNLGSAKNCPSKKLGLCELCDKCYAMKPEIQYPDCLPYRERQAKYWLNVSAETFALQFIAIYLKKRIKPTFIRFNESGDFYSQECVNKIFKIARLIYEATGIKSYTYTHRTDLDFSDLYNSHEFINILKSGNNSNPWFTANYKAITPAQFKREKTNKYYANRCDSMQEIEYYKNIYFCPANCKKCTLCATVKKGTIYTELH